MRKPIDWGLEYGFVQRDSNNWQDMCWYAERGYQDLPHFIKQFVKWIFKKDVYFMINLNDSPIYLRK